MIHSIRSRLFALLLCAVLLLSLSVPLVTAQEGTLSANRAVRHTPCLSLSTQAKDYYTADDTYESLSALCGMFSPSDSQKVTQDNPLYTALQALMTQTHTNQRVTYSGYSSNALATYWASTDSADGTDSYLYFYTDVDAASVGYQMNREHVWPKSKASYYQKGGGADLHHLRPSIAGVNSSKSNNTFADLNGTGKAYKVDGKDVIWTGDGKLEVRDNVKGDVARILLYVYCRWGQPNLYSDVDYELLPPFDSDDSANSGIRAIEDLDTLLEWMLLDPVDEWEMTRNDQAENVQGNRNVFIDYPELAWLMFGLPIPSEMQTPSGMASQKIHQWDTGIQVQKPSCTQHGLIRYTCADCGKTLDARTPALGHDYSEPIEQQSPTCTEDGALCRICSRCGDTASEPIPALGHDYTEGVCVRCGEALPIYLLTNELHDGDTVLLYAPAAGAALSSVRVSTSCLGSEAESPENGIIYTDSTSTVWSVYAINDGFLLAAGDGTVLSSGEENGLPSDGFYRIWSVSKAQTENCVCLTSDGGKTLKYTASDRGFSSGAFDPTQEAAFAVQIYTRVYCLHKNTELRSLAPTCTASGYTDAVFCTDCGAKLENGTALPPLGHSYTSEVTAPTCEADGCIAYACIRCDSAYTETLKALEHQMDEGVVTMPPTCEAAGLCAYHCTRCDYSYEAEIAALGHEMGEWVVTVPASCDSDGVQERTCLRCDYSETETVPAHCASRDFADVPASGYWAHPGIDFCIDSGIMGSTSPDTLVFSPGGTTTRATVVTILYSLSGKPEAEYAAIFPDVAEGQWFTPAVLWAYRNGVVTGYDTGYFGANDPVTREQLAVILKSYTEKVLGQGTSARTELTAFGDAAKVTWSKDAVSWAVASGLISGKLIGGMTLLDPQGTATRAEAAMILMKFCSR